MSSWRVFRLSSPDKYLSTMAPSARDFSSSPEDNFTQLSQRFFGEPCNLASRTITSPSGWSLRPETSQEPAPSTTYMPTPLPWFLRWNLSAGARKGSVSAHPQCIAWAHRTHPCQANRGHSATMSQPPPQECLDPSQFLDAA